MRVKIILKIITKLKKNKIIFKKMNNLQLDRPAYGVSKN